MARIRSIKPEFFTSLTIADLPLSARLTFIGLWTYVDDNGVGLDDARLVRAAVWPLEETPDILQRTREDLQRLQESLLVTRYTYSGKALLAVRSWSEHQKVSHPRKPRYPGPEHADTTPPEQGKSRRSEPSGNPPENLQSPPESLRPEQGAGSREQGAGSRDVSVADDAIEGELLDPADVAAAAEPPGATITQIRRDIDQACNVLADLIEANGSPRPPITQKWRDSARLMLDKDGIALDDVLAAARWSQADQFWRSNVLSMPKLREKYQTLRLQAQRGQHAATGTDGRLTGTDARVAEHMALTEQLRALEQNR